MDIHIETLHMYKTQLKGNGDVKLSMETELNYFLTDILQCYQCFCFCLGHA